MLARRFDSVSRLHKTKKPDELEPLGDVEPGRTDIPNIDNTEERPDSGNSTQPDKGRFPNIARTALFLAQHRYPDTKS